MQEEFSITISAEAVLASSQYYASILTFQYSLLSISIQAVQTVLMVLFSGVALDANFAPSGFDLQVFSGTSYILQVEQLVALVDSQSIGEIESLAMTIAFGLPNDLTLAETETIMASYTLLEAGLSLLIELQESLMSLITGEIYQSLIYRKINI